MSTAFSAAEKKTSSEKNSSRSSSTTGLPGPIYVTLIEVEGEEGLSLIWSRSNRD